MSSSADTNNSLKQACLEAQIIESIEKMREEMNMSPQTSKLADKLRNQASTAIAHGQEQLGDRKTLELAWNLFQILIEKSKEYAAEEEELQKLQNELAQTEKEIEIKKKALKVNQCQIQWLESLYMSHST
ncbi:hypothetical protein ACHAPV_006827 [Trichoderma viride]